MGRTVCVIACDFLLLPPWGIIAPCVIAARISGSKQKLGGVNVLFGNSIWRSHFTGETRKLIFARGILGVFFLFGIASFTVIKVLTEPIRELRLISTQTIRTPDSELPIEVQRIPWGVVITKYYDTHPDFKTLGLAVNVHALRNSDTLIPDCTHLASEYQESDDYMAIHYQCPVLDTEDSVPDLLVTVNFSALGIPIDTITDVPKNSVQVMVANTNKTDNVVLMTIPTTLMPGVNLIGLIYSEIYQVFTDPGLSLSGLFDSTQSIIIGQMVNVFQDPQAGISPLIVRSPEIATIRLIPQFDHSLWKVTQDSRTKSVLNGLSQAGGLWTFLSGIFAVFFGSSLMHILFNTKPVSIFGIAHSWERKTIQRAYREDYPAIKEEIHVSQDRRGLLCLLQDHILDLNLIEESGSEFRQGFSAVPEEDRERGLEEPKTPAD
ncbi:hypothetical protein BDN70DRAFT_930098 [Pholiota conissans]|uniref:Uncharacterized protein n=1 Tax=Pholiota conissans TaxID=109636 RepID=A0A9P5Z7S9_9AGAR|nr:hypothetical protein BDN70DRAFT_930098 [Pholiota conissans]